MITARTTMHSIGIGIALGLAGLVTVMTFASAFFDGATWSPVTQRGGPGVLFVVAPALAGWFGIAPRVRSIGSSLAEAISLSALATVPVGIVGLTLDHRWTGAPPVLESLFSTAAVALVVSTVAAVCVRLSSESQQQE